MSFFQQVLLCTVFSCLCNTGFAVSEWSYVRRGDGWSFLVSTFQSYVYSLAFLATTRSEQPEIWQMGGMIIVSLFGIYLAYEYIERILGHVWDIVSGYINVILKKKSLREVRDDQFERALFFVTVDFAMTCWKEVLIFSLLVPELKHLLEQVIS